VHVVSSGRVWAPFTALVIAGLAAGGALAASAPGVVTGAAVPVNRTTAVLRGYVNPRGSATVYYFEWGTTTAYGQSGVHASAGNGTTPRAVSQTAAGLTPDTTYHYRLVASNASGMAAGVDRTFKTSPGAPLASTGAATNVNQTGAVLVGSVNPDGRATVWYFQWGTSTRYGQQTAARALAGASSSQVVADPLEGVLAPGTVYHYRLVARNSVGIATGADSSFMTYPVHPPTPRVSAKTRPKHAQNQPYTFKTSGKLTRPSSIPSTYACKGTVTIRFYRGSRQVAYRQTNVKTNCKFSARTTFRHLPGPRGQPRPVHLRIVIRFLKTPYLAGSRAPVEHVTLG
jgi:hypothetical protein